MIRLAQLLRLYLTMPNILQFAPRAPRFYPPRAALSLGWLMFFALTCPMQLWGQYFTTQLTSLAPFGGKAGSEFEVLIAGVDLDDVHELHFSHPGITATQKMASPYLDKPPAPVEKQFVVKIAPDVPRGYHEVRAKGVFGLSNPRTFVVETHPEAAEVEPNDKRDQAQEIPLNTIINGKVEQERSDFFKFKLAAGQRVLIECLAYRADSALDATLALTNEAGTEVARSNDALRRDPLLDFTAPADGVYTLELYDFLFRGGENHVYRLNVSTAPRVEFIVPNSGLAGSTAKYTLYGRNLAGGTKSAVKAIDGAILDQIEQEITLPPAPAPSTAHQELLLEPQDAGLDSHLYRANLANGQANGVQIFFAQVPVSLETEPNNDAATAQTIAVPGEIAGQFQARGDQDYFTFNANKGETWWIEVISERLGQSTDPYLLVQRVTKNEQGQESVQDLVDLDDPRKLEPEIRELINFDFSSSDTVYKLTVPETGAYRILVRDLYYQSRGNPQLQYRLIVRPATPDFRLLAVAEPPRNQQNANQVTLWSPVLGKGCTQGIRLYVLRQDDFYGDIRISAEGLPAGVTCPEIVVGGNCQVANLVLKSADDVQPWTGPIKIVGRAQIGDKPVEHPAAVGSLVWGTQDRSQIRSRGRLTGDLVLSVNPGESQPLLADVGPGALVETSRAGRMEIPIKLNRRGEFKEGVKVHVGGLPKGIRMNDVDIGGDSNEGKVLLEVRENAVPGTYTFALQLGTNLKDYRRNPAGAEAAEKRKAAVLEEFKVADEKFQQAQQAKPAADQALQNLENMIRQTGDALNNANQAVQQAQEKLNAANAALEAATKAASEKPDDAGLKGNQENAAKAKTEAETALTQATTTKQTAEKAHQDELAKKPAMEAAKADAEKAVTETQQRRAIIENAKNTTVSQADQLINAAKPRNLPVVLYSQPVTVKIAEYPFKWTLEKTTIELKPKEKVELPIKTERFYGFNEEIRFRIENADKKGLKNAEVVIPRDQNEGKLILEALDAPPPAEHQFPVLMRLNWNGVELKGEQMITVKILPP
ncbi:MAG: PPC domain-containing protein [Pirellulales bacterium]|nr:PPC domain-containing protein [Pirellulales bacterium]